MNKPRKQLALDTNFVLDLADGADFAHELRAICKAKEFALRLMPTSAMELRWKSCHEPSLEKRTLARSALLKVQSWEIQPLGLANVEIAIAEQYAKRVILTGLLPPDEMNDALILAETSIAQIPILVTADKHLLDMDETDLALLFNQADLTSVVPVHPKRLLRALR